MVLTPSSSVVTSIRICEVCARSMAASYRSR
jgi:hypothetical protein